ncbi:MAG: cytochrome c oxidase assembly protein [Anaerolineae bacterium]
MPDPSFDFWLKNWYFEPSIVLGLLGLYGGYILATGRYRSRFAHNRPLTSGQFAAFTSGVVVLVIALLSPLDRLGDAYWFTAHMIQHVLLTLVAPPLLIIGAPGWLYEPLRGRRSVLGLATASTNPYLAFFVFNFVFAIWHVPSLYDAALQNEGVHILEHLSFIVTALLTWMPVLSPTPLLPRLSPPLAVLYLFLQSLPPTILGAIITFDETALYSFYVTAPRLWGLSVMDDQLWAGLVMWIGGALIWLLALSVIFFKWFNRQESVEGQGLI